jgi:NADH-quinone oxidoreductase subunit F
MSVLTCTQNFGKGAQDIGVYKANGGYSTIDERLFALSQFEMIDLVSRSGLRGRGGAGFPTGMKWSFVPRNGAKPVYLVVNADEGEPGTFKDHALMLEDPHRLIEGMILCGWALGVRTAYIYVRGEFLKAIETLNAALKQAYAAGYLGENIQGSGYSLDIYVHRGAGAYICGEETALINSLEGYKGQPRLKPPFPAVSGAFASPTCVNNVETLMQLPWIFENGPEAFLKLGTPKSGGTKVFSVSGDVKRPGVYEIPLGTPMMELLTSEKYCQGIIGELKGVIPGGSSSPVLTAEEAEKAMMDYESLASLKSMLGSGAVVVFNKSRNVVGMLKTLTRFYAHESCGQCTPCREGTGYADRILKTIVAGKGRTGDLDHMLDLAANFSYTTICALAIADAWPIENFIGKFRSEFEAEVAKNPDRDLERVNSEYRPGGFW